MNLSELSDLLVWAAITAYTISMVCFSFDLARISDAVGMRKRNKSLVAPDGSEIDAAHESAAAVTAANVIADANAKPGVAQISSLSTEGEGERITYVGRKTKALGIAMSTLWLGALIHLGAVIVRALAAGRAPWANLYEFTLTGTFAAIIVFLAVQMVKEIRFVGVFVTFLVVTFLMVAMQAFHLQADAVQPALQRYWLVVHVGIAVLATGVFTIAFVVSGLQLLRDAYDNKKISWKWLIVLPATDRLEALSFRVNAVGFVMWTFTIIGGAIWADEAWGRAWGWDPKETWSFVIWVVYAAYLHARTTRGWSGRRAAWFVIIGYICVILNFTVVNFVFSGKHSYAGI